MLRGLHGCVSDRSATYSRANDYLTGIAKKWLEALKGDVFYPETFSYMMKAFQSLLGATLSTESLRSLALYITFAVHRPKRNEPRPLRSTKSLRKPRQVLYRPTRSSTISFTSSGPTQDGNGIPRTMTRLEIGIKILGMYTDLLCGKDTTNTKKFARTVTNKVLWTSSNRDGWVLKNTVAPPSLSRR